MRSISVSTDVYAAIWSARVPGEDSEDAILARLLKVRSEVPDKPATPATAAGFVDARFDVVLPQGFEIFRTYKGTNYRAHAVDGHWKLLTTGQLYNSLNQLSRAASGNIENAWRNWYFMGKDGKRHLVEGLRNDVTPNVRHLI